MDNISAKCGGAERSDIFRRYKSVNSEHFSEVPSKPNKPDTGMQIILYTTVLCPFTYSSSVSIVFHLLMTDGGHLTLYTTKFLDMVDISFMHKVVLAFIAFNGALASALYKFTDVDSSITLIAQLMLPLIVWQILLIAAFFPEQFLMDFIDELYRQDGAAGDQPLLFGDTTQQEIHSHGDVPHSPRLTADDNDVELIES